MSLQQSRGQGRSAAWNLLSLIAFASLGSRLIACNSGETVDGGPSGPTAAVTNGTGYDPPCHGGERDGFCDALSQDPESCMCLDCAQTAYCKQLCNNNGTCDSNAGEDCTCVDCLGKTIGMQKCQLAVDPQGQGPAPATTAPATVSTGNTGNTTANTTAPASSTAAGAGGAGGGSTGAGN